MDGRAARHKQLNPPRCPKCGGEIVVRQLEIEDEAGEETVFLFNCKNGDFNAGATEETLTKMVMADNRQ